MALHAFKYIFASAREAGGGAAAPTFPEHVRSPKHDDEAPEKQKDRYLRKIGDLEMRLDFAKRVSRKLGIEIPADD